MKRDEAHGLMTDMIKNKNLQKHGLAVEAIMRVLCDYLQKKHPELGPEEFDMEEWAIVGLLHDADYELIEKDESRHTLVTEQKLREVGEERERVINGIKAHHATIKPNRENLMERAVYCADELSGLITAVALVRPDKKLESVSTESVLKKFPQKEFAKGANREQIAACEEELGIPLEEFVALGLQSMKDIHEELGL
jgi:predicted hydrolase (HD superfamily)